MLDQTADARRRILAEASLQSREEWSAVVTAFYRILRSHHPRLAVHFVNTDLTLLVKQMVALLTFVAREMPDRDLLARTVYQTGLTHVARGIGRTDFLEFIALLANVLADRDRQADREVAHNVWYQELVVVAEAMLRAAPD